MWMRSARPRRARRPLSWPGCPPRPNRDVCESFASATGVPSSFDQVMVAPIATLTVAGLNAKPLMLIATGLGDAVGLGLGLALGADDALAQPTRASAAMSPRPTARTARRITTSDRVFSSPYARVRPRDDCDGHSEQVGSQQRRARHGDEIRERVRSRYETLGQQTDRASVLLGCLNGEEIIDDRAKLVTGSKTLRDDRRELHAQSARIAAPSFARHDRDPGDQPNDGWLVLDPTLQST